MAAQFQDRHRRWLREGFEDGVFLPAGAWRPNLGSGIVASNTTLPERQSRINADPFVVANVVSAELHEVEASKMDQRLEFLLS